MKCKYWDCGFCYAPDDVVTSASPQGACYGYDFCPYLKTEMNKKTFNIEPEVIEDIYFRLGIESPTNEKQRGRERNLIRSGYEMAHQNQQPEVMSSGTAIISDKNGVPTKVHLSDEEKLTEMTEKMDSVESIEVQIKILQSKLEFYKELEKTKSPVEEAFKDNYGVYSNELKTTDDFNCWKSFKRGYTAAQKDYKVGEFQETAQELKTLFQMLDGKYCPDACVIICDIVKEWMYQYDCDYATCREYLEGYEECQTVLEERLK